MEVGFLIWSLLPYLAAIHCHPVAQPQQDDLQDEAEDTDNVERKIEKAIEAADPAVLATALAGNPNLINITLQHADKDQLGVALRESNLDILKVVLSQSKPELLMAALDSTLENLRVILTGANDDETTNSEDQEFEKENEIDDTALRKDNTALEEVFEDIKELDDFEELENLVSETTNLQSRSNDGRDCQSKDEGYFGICTTPDKCTNNEFSYSVTCSFEFTCCKHKV